MQGTGSLAAHRLRLAIHAELEYLGLLRLLPPGLVVLTCADIAQHCTWLGGGGYPSGWVYRWVVAPWCPVCCCRLSLMRLGRLGIAYGNGVIGMGRWSSSVRYCPLWGMGVVNLTTTCGGQSDHHYRWLI